MKKISYVTYNTNEYVNVLTITNNIINYRLVSAKIIIEVYFVNKLRINFFINNNVIILLKIKLKLVNNFIIVKVY